MLLVDELSEFLRSKSDRAAFNEDVRTLQFLGEWAMAAPFTIVAAMQEQIEHTGDLDTGLYRKIKDRFPIRLTLTPTHTRQLLRDHLLLKSPAYDEAVHHLARRLRQALPDASFSEAELCAVYPIHPVTLDLLEEVRDGFSRTRGVVDFVVTRLGGDPTRGVEPFLDQPWGHLLTPDRIIDHFADVLALQPEYFPLTQRLFPWAERSLDALFDSDRLRSLARQLVNLLALTWLAPAREGITVDEASTWLLFAATRVEPDRNRRIVQRVLDRLTTDGRYIRQRDAVYTLDLTDDSQEQLQRLVERTLRDLPVGPEALLSPVAARLGQARFDPLALSVDRNNPREITWRFHARPIAVWLGNGAPEPTDGAALCVRLPWGDAPPAPGVTTVLPRQLTPSAAHRRLAALVALMDGTQTPPVRERLVHALAEGLNGFRAEVRASFAEARVCDGAGRTLASPHVDGKTTTQSWLSSSPARSSPPDTPRSSGSPRPTARSRASAGRRGGSTPPARRCPTRRPTTGWT